MTSHYKKNDEESVSVVVAVTYVPTLEAVAVDIENPVISRRETERHEEMAFYGCRIQILAIITLICLWITLVYQSDINYYNKFERVYGVHQTNFTFTGNYTIITTYDNYNDLVYNVNCISYTCHYGNCEYLYYSTNNYYEIDTQLETFCTEGVKIDGYISTETGKCTDDNPNRSIDELIVRVKIFTIITILLGTMSLLCCFLFCRSINS